MLTVNAKIIAAAATCQAYDDVRYYLNGIYFEPLKKGGVRAVATDGHRMIVLTDSEGVCKKPIILRFDNAAITKMKAAKAETVSVKRLDEDTIVAKIESLNHISTAEIIDGKFPKWGHVIPDKLPGKSAQISVINGEYLCDMAKVAKILNITKCELSIVHGELTSNSVCIAFGKPGNGNLSVRGLIMPMNSSVNWLP